MARKPAKPKPLTSTSAFRAYLREVDAIVELVDSDRLSRGDALDRQGRLASVLYTQLGRLFAQRLNEAPAEGGEVLTIERYPVAQLRDLATHPSYVHPARTPETKPGEPPAGPAEPVDDREGPRTEAPEAAAPDDAGGGE